MGCGRGPHLLRTCCSVSLEWLLEKPQHLRVLSTYTWAPERLRPPPPGEMWAVVKPDPREQWGAKTCQPQRRLGASDLGDKRSFAEESIRGHEVPGVTQAGLGTHTRCQPAGHPLPTSLTHQAVKRPPQAV